MLDLTLNEAEIGMDETPILRIEYASYPTKPLEKPDSHNCIYPNIAIRIPVCPNHGETATNTVALSCGEAAVKQL